MEKLILKKQRYRTNSQQYRIRVSGEVYEIVDKLSDCLKNDTFAFEHTQVVGEEEKDVR